MSASKTVDTLRGRMLLVGSRLLGEIARERALYARLKRRAVATRKAWDDSRTRVDELAAEYADAIAAYRQAMDREVQAWRKRTAKRRP